MIYNLVFILLISCLNNNENVLSETDWSKHNLKGKVSFYKETSGSFYGKSYNFNKDGYLVNEFYGGGNRTYHYKNNRLEKVESYVTNRNSMEKEKNGYWEYEFNDLRKISKETYIRLSDDAHITTQMIYDKNGFVKEYLRYEHSTICEYDSIGNMVSKIQYRFKDDKTRNDSTLIIKENFEYNSKNLLTTHSSLRTNKTIVYNYNSANDIIKKTIKIDNKQIKIENHSYEYTYDSIGNWITKTHIKPNGKITNYERKYRYYK